MQHSFFQNVTMAFVAGFAAACLLWTYRHIIERSRYEMAEGWKESLTMPAK